ncbi:MAG TPA: hypothetical protein VLC09_16080 [Polyangiaceae bacterium]|nr:hypothetical protein [Polyangiaceae bacterium]
MLRFVRTSSQAFLGSVCLLGITVSLSLAGCGGDPAPEDDADSGGGGGQGGDSANPDGDGDGDGAVGYFFGPIDSEVGFTIGGESLSATIGEPQDAIDYSSALFQTAAPLEPTTNYEVTIESSPAGQVCRVFAGVEGTGEELSVTGAIRVGCEWGFDFVGRSSDDQTLAYSNNSRQIVIGGSSRTIGDTEPLGDGRFVAFRSSESGLAPNSAADENIYFRDRVTGETYLVSHDPDGGPADGRSEQPAISADGLHVIFQSEATNLVEGDTNGETDIFVWSALDDTIVRVSVGPSGEEADASSREATISGDGSVVAFATQSTTVVPTTGDSTTLGKVVRIDLTSGERTVVTRLLSTGDPTSGSWPMLTEDGNRLVFYAYNNVVGDENPNLWDAFVYEHDSGDQWPITRTESGGNRNQGNESTSGIIRPSISGDGKWVTYGTSSTNLVAGVDDGLWHVYLVEADDCSAAGCNVVVLDQTDDVLADEAATSERATLSYDGRYVALTSAASNLGVDNNDKDNAFVYDRQAGTLTPLTRISEGYGGTYTDAVFSPDGAYVAVGIYLEMDPRFDTDGLFVAYTGLSNAFSWLDGPIE